MEHREGKENLAFSSLFATVRHLRGENGCPWDRAQTHKSLRRYLIEEAYEVAEAIDNCDPTALCEELGDLTLQVLLHAVIAEEEGHFSLSDVLEGENRKMIYRHPAVFAPESENAQKGWEELKREEKAKKPKKEETLAVPPQLPALMRAQRLFEKAGDGIPDEILSLSSTLAPLLAGRDGERGAKLLLALVLTLGRAGIDCEAELSRLCAELAREIKNGETAC